MKYLDMNFKGFDDFLQMVHCDENPGILDDDLPDAYVDWSSNLSYDDWIVYGEMYGNWCKHQKVL
jgi:hypothetical protein